MPLRPTSIGVDLHRARFYAILDTSYVPRSRWRETCAALIEGGADLVQVRAKRETPEERAELVKEVLPLFTSAGPPSSVGPEIASVPSQAEAPDLSDLSLVEGVSVPFSDSPARNHRGSRPYLIINDDADLCAATPGAGLHIGQDDMAPAEARARIGPNRVLGLSTHSWAQAEAAMALPAGVISYFCVGPLFATATKPDYMPVGLELVHRVAAAKPALPWFAIGGITRANVAAVTAAGAPRVVVVSDVLLAADPAAAVRDFLSSIPTR